MLHLYQDQPIGGADILNSLADVNINNPENKQIIYYDQATGTWRNYDPPFVNSENVLHTVEECAASTNPEDVAGASVASSLNSALENVCYNKIAYGNWEHTITASEASNSVFTVSNATLYPNARMIIPIGVLTNGKILGVIRSGTSYICYGMTANASMNLYFVAIL